MSIAGMGWFKFRLQWAFVHAPLSHISLCISWAFLFVTRYRTWQRLVV